LLSVVSNKGMWDAESTYDRAPKEICYIVGGDGCEGFDLGPLGEIVYCNKKEFPPSFSRWHGSNYVNTSFLEWPRRGDRAKFFRAILHHPSKSLTLIALLNQPDRVFVHCWPVIPSSHCLVRQHPRARMVPANPFMYFLEHIFCVGVCETLEEQLGISSLVKYPPNEHVWAECIFIL
jgi:hypothetical protein